MTTIRCLEGQLEPHPVLRALCINLATVRHDMHCIIHAAVPLSIPFASCMFGCADRPRMRNIPVRVRLRDEGYGGRRETNPYLTAYCTVCYTVQYVLARAVAVPSLRWRSKSPAGLSKGPGVSPGRPWEALGRSGENVKAEETPETN
jgi:hypothetical protein